MSLRFEVLKQEADLRFALVRVRENSESIAFYGGSASEEATALGRLRIVILTHLSRIRWAALLEVWRNCYVYATILVPSLVTAPRYFSGEIQFGVVTQVCAPPSTYPHSRVSQKSNRTVIAVGAQRCSCLGDPS